MPINNPAPRTLSDDERLDVLTGLRTILGSLANRGPLSLDEELQQVRVQQLVADLSSAQSVAITVGAVR